MTRFVVQPSVQAYHTGGGERLDAGAAEVTRAGGGRLLPYETLREGQLSNFTQGHVLLSHDREKNLFLERCGNGQRSRILSPALVAKP